MGSTRLMDPRLFRKANPRAQRADEPRPIGLRTLWLAPRGWLLTIKELLCLLGALADERFR